MTKHVLLTLLLVAPLGCAFRAGPVGFAFGDTEASRCLGGTVVESDGSYICEGQHELARGSHIGDNITKIFTGVFDLVRGLVAGLGKGLASVGDPIDDGVES